MSRKDATFTMRLDAERKEQWTELAEESGFDGLSDLVRFTLSQFEQGNLSGSVDTPSNSAVDISAIPDDLENRLKRIESKIDGVDNSVDVVKNEVTSADLGNLTAPARDAVISQLPAGESWSDGVPADVIAQDLGTRIGAVEQTLERSEAELSIIKREKQNGELRYWKADTQ
ncbi:hypothetical protein GOC83_09875 [Haloarcula rubripromontorii]|uniref:Uncharacterized protein n=1 Tax=Haloarcula rubripromontorii TaxID=1705562 RepID=A0A847TZD1_9EURY|nr:hypothetical protein [Haloarcula rubripromontorii]NLV06435.1 hypothetical protein [Haloarcula rubripromontorii]